MYHGTVVISGGHFERHPTSRLLSHQTLMLSPCADPDGSVLFHQALQQVVGAAAIYKHLLVKHGVVAAKRTGGGSDGTDGSGGGTVCGCGGAVGSCKVPGTTLQGSPSDVGVTQGL